MTPLVRVTGILRGSDGELARVEVEVQGGSGRVQLVQGPGPLPDSQVGALVVDGVPEVVAFEAGGENGALALLSEAVAPLAKAPATAALLDEERVLALRDVLLQLGDGLYTVGATTSCLPPRPRRGYTKAVPGGSVGVIDLVAAPDAGAPVLASLGRCFALLAGRSAAAAGTGAWIIAADVIVDAAGFEARLHDRGSREAFARSPRAGLDDAALRDALAAMRKGNDVAGGDVELGPFTEDRVEPAAQQARALVWDLRAEDGIESVADPVRERVGTATEFRARVRVKSVTLELAFVSHDGRHVDEAVVRSGTRFRATGLRPAARTLARTLRQLADEGL